MRGMPLSRCRISSSVERWLGVCVSRNPFERALPDGLLVDFAGMAEWEILENEHVLRALIPGQETPAPVTDLLHRDRLAQLHTRAADLAPVCIRDTDHRGLRDGGMPFQHFFDLGRIDVFAAADEHFFAVPDHVVIALRVAPEQIACAHPAFGKRLASRLRVVPITGKEMGARMSSSPTSSGPASAPFSFSIRVSMWKFGKPTEPSLRMASSAGSEKQLGPASVNP